ncbi:Ionotropic receptor 21a [Frankliniella fusca]|uniref:Ionotropic receptor 21a n=1 Tax=Frankliniella fusca TaxID=407009 RepID=A0AAE1HZD0_9NEOP|nr:Ionotropic receptor 21a [Frankliniella fusca]
MAAAAAAASRPRPRGVLLLTALLWRVSLVAADTAAVADSITLTSDLTSVFDASTTAPDMTSPADLMDPDPDLTSLSASAATTPWYWGGPTTAESAPNTTAPNPVRPGPERPLVRHLLGNLVRATAAPDTIWAATVEKQRCFLPPGAPSPIAGLVARLAERELEWCDPALIWDASLPAGEDTLREVISAMSRPYVLARTPLTTAAPWLYQPVNPPYTRRRRGSWRHVLPPRQKCRHILAIVDDVMSVGALLGNLSEPRVVVVTRSPRWRIRDYLASAVARNIRNLLVVHDRAWRHGSAEAGYPDVNLFTHRLFMDSLGYSRAEVLTSWRCDRLTRPDVDLFPVKMLEGFAGHQFGVSASDTPPYLYRTVLNTDGDLHWDGIEVRLLHLLAERLNFTMAIRDASNDDVNHEGSAVSVVNNVVSGISELGAGGIYITPDRVRKVDFGFYHTQDCASFMAFASVALPRYRAIMGPFQLSVWLALTFTYMFAILPLVYSHSFSLRILVKHPSQIENMFWYVFGTFTNSFSFKGRDSWTGTSRTSTRMIIGWYWVFSIIVTACYTGCIISFIAFPVFPTVVDYIWQLWEGNYQIGTLDTDGWATWFRNSSDPMVDKLLEDMDTVPHVWDGIVNITRAYFWKPYSFLGSRLYLEHVVQTNYTAENKRSLMHVTKECLAPFWVALIFPKAATYSERFNQLLMRAMQTGITEKLRRDVAWDVMRRQAKNGRTLLQVSSGSSLKLKSADERMLTLDDTQGMFLLLGAGFAIASFALFIENMTGRIEGCRRHCQPGPRRRSSVPSLPPELRDLLSLPANAAGRGGRDISDTPSPGPAADTEPSGDHLDDVGQDSVRRRRPSVTVQSASVASLDQAWTEVTTEAVVSAVSAAAAFRRGSVDTLREAWADRATAPGVGAGEDEHHLRVLEDHVLHLSNAWSDRSEASDDAHLRVVGAGAGGGDTRRGSRCSRASSETPLPTTPEHPDDDEGEAATRRLADAEEWRPRPPRSGRSSLFGSPVPPADEVDAAVEDDSCTYVLLHSSSEDLAPPRRPPTPYLRPAVRPVASKLGHRRRSSVAAPDLDLPRHPFPDNDAEHSGSGSPRRRPPTASFPDTPESSPRHGRCRGEGHGRTPSPSPSPSSPT